MSPDKKKKYNEKTKLRMKKYRERKKAQGIATPSRPKTRKENEKQRDIWRRNKQEQRLNMTAQKRRRINEQRRKKYHEKKQRTTPSDANLDSEANSVPENYQTDCAKRKAVSRSIKVLPKDANKFAEVVSRIIAKSTPRKKAALKEKCIASPSSKKRLDMLESSCINLKDTLRGIKKKRSKKDNHTRRLLNQIMLARNTLSGCKNLHEQFGLSKNIKKKIDKGEDILEQERKKRKDALSEEDIKHVQDFYKKSYISREMPSMNAVNKMALEGSLKRTYDQYKHEYPDKKISYAKFANLRPKQVLPMSKQKYMQCLCEYCINIDFKIETLKSFCSVRKLESIAVDRYDISRITLCPKEGGHYKKDCLDRNCRDCGLTKIDEKVDRVLGNFKNSQVTWKRWQISEKESLVNGNKVTKSFMDMKRKSGTIENLVDELKTELSTFSKHLFNAQWQSKQFEDLKVNLPKKWVLMCLDFAENYTCRHQDEAQGAHWRYEQVTIHPLVTYYHCPIEGCTHIMRESLVFISEDHKHDYHMVQHCVAKANAYLLENLEEISKQIQFSDGAPTQYKSKYNFVDLSYSNDDFGFETEKHFFGSRHGKGPCDGESGVVKRSATVAVGTRGCIISNAHDFFEYAKNQLTLPKQNSETHCHSKRTFFFIKADEVVRERPDRTHRVKTLQNSRSMFSFRGIQPYITTSRERSCFCAICIGQETGVCPVQSLTGQWKVNNLKIRERHRRNQQTVTEETVNADHVDVNAEIHEMDNPDVPEMDNPDVPEMDNPDVPEMDNPDVPEMDIADIDNPEVPEIDNPDVPEMDNPEVPKIDSPDIQEMIIAEIENLGVPEMDNPVKDQINDLEMFPLEDLDVNQLTDLDIDMPQTEVPLYSVGQYVVSSLSSDKRISPTLFIAQIKDIGSDEVFLKFMAKDTSGFYYWPSNDQGWEPFKSIKRVIEEPTPVPEKSKKRRLLYRVDF